MVQEPHVTYSQSDHHWEGYSLQICSLSDAPEVQKSRQPTHGDATDGKSVFMKSSYRGTRVSSAACQSPLSKDDGRDLQQRTAPEMGGKVGLTTTSKAALKNSNLLILRVRVHLKCLPWQGRLNTSCGWLASWLQSVFLSCPGHVSPLPGTFQFTTQIHRDARLKARPSIFQQVG